MTLCHSHLRVQSACLAQMYVAKEFREQFFYMFTCGAAYDTLLQSIDTCVPGVVHMIVTQRSHVQTGEYGSSKHRRLQQATRHNDHATLHFPRRQGITSISATNHIGHTEDQIGHRQLSISATCRYRPQTFSKFALIVMCITCRSHLAHTCGIPYAMQHVYTLHF